MSEINADVLIVGAGPTGLCMAYFLTRQGVRVRIIERKARPADESRAMGVQARTLEFYRQFGIAEAAVELGLPTRQVHLYVDGEPELDFSLAEMGAGMSPYPYMLTLAQDVHERFLIAQLAELGVVVEWGTSLVALEQDDTRVHVMLERDGQSARASVPWLVGCDGASSITRRALELGFDGGTSSGLFFVADVHIGRPNEDLIAGLSSDTISIMMPVRTKQTQRLLGFVPPALRDREDLTFEDVSSETQRLLGIQVQEVNWFSTYKVHHRVADRFRRGRCFIAGDAGHIHSPVGGQGMNTGIGDAMNLAWKLAGVVRGRTDASVLDSYERERITFARALVQTTDKAFQKLSSDSVIAGLVRNKVAPVLMRWITGWESTSAKVFRTVSQIKIDYADSALSAGGLGELHAGERLPWVAQVDNYQPLAALDWQVHVYGVASDELLGVAGRLGLEVYAFAWSEDIHAAGFTRDGVYLLRPDGHIALATPSPKASVALLQYAEAIGLKA